MKQIKPFNPIFHLGQMASELKWDSKNNLWVLKTDEETIIKARVIIIAAGGGSFVPKNRHLMIVKSMRNLVEFNMQ